jgi:hypothetical protein
MLEKAWAYLAKSDVVLTPEKVKAARAIALVADALQIGVFPAFSEGFASPFNDALDVVVAIVMLRLVGWHWALLPGFVSELVPVWDLVPTWTAAVWIATSGTAASPRPSVSEVPPTARRLEPPR